MSSTNRSADADRPMPPLSRREAAKKSVIASGNAQAVLRRLDEVVEEREVNLARWAWELLQNARDAAATECCVNVAVRFDDKALKSEKVGSPPLGQGREAFPLIRNLQRKQPDWHVPDGQDSLVVLMYGAVELVDQDLFIFGVTRSMCVNTIIAVSKD